MITRMTGTLTRVLDEEVRLQIGPIEYQILIPEFVRRQLQLKIGEEVSFYITEYLEGGPNANRFIPRRLGFLTETDLEFFDLFCTVDKIGAKKALKAFARPIREIAEAIHRQDVKWLTTLPGIGAASAEQIVTTLKKKVLRYTFASESSADAPAATAPQAHTQARVFEDAYQFLLAMGMAPAEARDKLDKAMAAQQNFESVQDVIHRIFRHAQ